MAVAGPPGALGETERLPPVEEPDAVAPALTGDVGRGVDCMGGRVSARVVCDLYACGICVGG